MSKKAIEEEHGVGKAVISQETADKLLEAGVHNEFLILYNDQLRLQLHMTNKACARHKRRAKKLYHANKRLLSLLKEISSMNKDANVNDADLRGSIERIASFSASKPS